MAAGEWVSVTSQNDLIERELRIERIELVHNVVHETEELAAVYEGHGMSPQLAAAAADEVMKSPDAALSIHAREELGVDPDNLPSPIGAASVSLFFFLVGAFLPIIPWFIGGGNRAAWASLTIGVAAAAVIGWLVGVGAERSRFRSSARQVLILLIACGITFLIGELVDVNLGS
jgi:VIT1/CCC1 family predicted Fe2+/Mn2+ transporter